MKRQRARRHLIEHENVERWLISYADYMTLLFALFVVLYAMAIVNEKPFKTATESLGRVFQAQEEHTKNRGHDDNILPVNKAKNKQIVFGDAMVDIAEPKIVSDDITLSSVSDAQLGSSLRSLEKALHEVLYQLVESGYAQLKVDDDWLEIELNSSLLFPSGSASPTNGAKDILLIIFRVIADTNNYIRVRGYTDNQAIKTEIFSSNWELSVFRATAILRMLEALTLNPARMAIEGYGQYYPNADNTKAAGRAKNRRVVIALSKYGLEKAKVVAIPTISEENVAIIKRTVAEDEIRIIELDNGGIRITTRAETNANSKTAKPSQEKINE
jgi:chemotaxis protein MotB